VTTVARGGEAAHGGFVEEFPAFDHFVRTWWINELAFFGWVADRLFCIIKEKFGDLMHGPRVVRVFVVGQVERQDESAHAVLRYSSRRRRSHSSNLFTSTALARQARNLGVKQLLIRSNRGLDPVPFVGMA
jgi:hypothetical protein